MGPPTQVRALRCSAPTRSIPSRGDGALSTNGIAARCLVSLLAGGAVDQPRPPLRQSRHGAPHPSPSSPVPLSPTGLAARCLVSLLAGGAVDQPRPPLRQSRNGAPHPSPSSPVLLSTNGIAARCLVSLLAGGGVREGARQQGSQQACARRLGCETLPAVDGD